MTPLKLAAHYGYQVLTDFENVEDNRCKDSFNLFQQFKPNNRSQYNRSQDRCYQFVKSIQVCSI